ncbi:Papain-like_cysteine peptidase superfamily [Hexamita inflata]|uniref:Papain-like cysteine peptidase superfamily n=1 Tax=Hexamita inflata TaxID=28002 RepID=A0AA86R0P7_9EUKA|nr:Papain-like cysteine peptidase superfamily [Hexamita inflata]
MQNETVQSQPGVPWQEQVDNHINIQTNMEPRTKELPPDNMTKEGQKIPDEIVIDIQELVNQTHSEISHQQKDLSGNNTQTDNPMSEQSMELELQLCKTELLLEDINSDNFRNLDSEKRELFYVFLLKSFNQYDKIKSAQEATAQYTEKCNFTGFLDKQSHAIRDYKLIALNKFEIMFNLNKRDPQLWSQQDLNIFKNFEVCQDEDQSYGSIISLNPRNGKENTDSEEAELRSSQNTEQSNEEQDPGKVNSKEINKSSDQSTNLVVKQNLVQQGICNQQLQKNSESLTVDKNHLCNSQVSKTIQQDIAIVFDDKQTENTQTNLLSLNDQFDKQIRQFEINNLQCDNSNPKARIDMDLYQFEEEYQNSDEFDLKNISKKLQDENNLNHESQFDRVTKITGKESDYDFNKYTIRVEKKQKKPDEKKRSFSGVKPTTSQQPNIMPTNKNYGKDKGKNSSKIRVGKMENNQLKTQENFQQYLNHHLYGAKMQNETVQSQPGVPWQEQVDNHINIQTNMEPRTKELPPDNMTKEGQKIPDEIVIDIQELVNQTHSEISHQQKEVIITYNQTSQLTIDGNNKSTIQLEQDLNIVEFFLTHNETTYSNDKWKKAMHGKKVFLNTKHGQILTSTIPNSSKIIPINIQAEVIEDLESLIEKRQLTDDLMMLLLNSLPQDAYNIINTQVSQYGSEIFPIEFQLYKQRSEQGKITFAPFIYSSHWYLCLIQGTKIYICDSLNGFEQAQKILLQEQSFMEILNNICDQHFGAKDANTRIIEAIKVKKTQDNNVDCGFVIFFIILQMIHQQSTVENLTSIDNNAACIQELRKRIIVFLAVYDKITDDKQTDKQINKNISQQVQQKNIQSTADSKINQHSHISKDDLYGFSSEPKSSSLQFRINNELQYISVEDAKFLALKQKKEEDSKTGYIDQFDVWNIENLIQQADDYVNGPDLVQKTTKLGLISTHFTNSEHKIETFNFGHWLSDKNLHNDNQYTEIFGHLGVYQDLKPCKFKVNNKNIVAFHDVKEPFIFASASLEFRMKTKLVRGNHPVLKFKQNSLGNIMKPNLKLTEYYKDSNIMQSQQKQEQQNFLYYCQATSKILSNQLRRM